MKGSKQIHFLKSLSFMHYGGKAIILPFLPLFLYGQGFTSVEIGTIMGVAPMMSIVAQPLVGFLSDKYKTIKRILLLLYLFVFAASFGIFFSGSFWIVFLAFLLFHFALSPATPLLDSMSIKTLGPEKRHEYGKIRLWGSIGFALTATTSGPLLLWVGIDKIYVLFWIITMLTMFLISFLKEQNQSQKPVSLKGVRDVASNKQFVLFLVLCLIIMIPHRTNDTMVVLYLENLGATSIMVGMAWAFAALSEVPVFYFITKKLLEYNYLIFFGVITFLYTIRWSLYAFIPSPYVITFLQLSQGITFGLFWIVALQTAVKFAPEHLRSTGQSLLTSVCFGIGGAIGGTLGGWIFGQFGASVLYMILASLSFTALIWIYFSYRTSLRRETAINQTPELYPK